MHNHAESDRQPLENRVHLLEQELTKLANQLNGMRKLFFKDRKGTRRRHSDLENPVMRDWAKHLPR